MDLSKRILDISYKKKLSHLGSCLSAVDIIDSIFENKKDDEKFVLSSGHAGLALYVVLEKKYGLDAEKIFDHHGVHPDRCKECHLDCSAGSLGQGLPIAVGMALSNRDKAVYCLISDGESFEGSIWESLNVAAEQNLSNLIIVVNANGYSAYKEVDVDRLLNKLSSFTMNGCPKIAFVRTTVEHKPFLKGLDAHYYVMKEGDNE